MELTIKRLIEQLNTNSEVVRFEEVMQVIAENYSYQASTFINGELVNSAGRNEGSCKIFAFAQLNNLTEQSTLNCFGQYYREDVLKHPQGNDHGNIRNFMNTGWSGINFEQMPLTAKL